MPYAVSKVFRKLNKFQLKLMIISLMKVNYHHQAKPSNFNADTIDFFVFVLFFI